MLSLGDSSVPDSRRRICWCRRSLRSLGAIPLLGMVLSSGRNYVIDHESLPSLSGFSGLAADNLVGIANAFALVWLRFAHLPNLCGHFTDDLLVDSAD
jgi:hypothetical protein